MAFNCSSKQKLELSDRVLIKMTIEIQLGLMGISGIILNSVVLVGVAGNARLGTTINKLLIWFQPAPSHIFMTTQ
jgi:hypothetical protein